MRKIYLSILTLCFGVLVSNAQSVRTVLVEEFTNAGCGPCASLNPALNSNLDAVEDQNVVALKYQTAGPGFDPMNRLNPTQVNERATHYNITGVPTAIVDGTALSSPANATVQSLQNRQTETAPILVKLSYEYTDTYDLLAKVVIVNEGDEAYENGSAKLRVALSENEIKFDEAPGSNGEKVFHDVFRAFINEGGSAGMAVGTIAAGDSLVVNMETTRPRTYDLREMRAIAFVQNGDNGEMINAAIADVKELEVYIDASLKTTSSVPESNCAESSTYMYEIKNDGDVEINNVTVAFVSGSELIGSSQEVDLNIAPGASQTFETNIEYGYGVNNIGSIIASVNGINSDFSLEGNIDQYTYVRFFDNVELPDEGFEDYAFDDEGKFNDNVDYVFGVTKVSKEDFGVQDKLGAYGESEGSVLIDFWGWNTETYSKVGYFSYGQFDLSEMADPQLSYDRAGAGYSDGFVSNDGIEVQVSKDCGASWVTLKEMYGDDLYTAPRLSDSRYVPSADEWITDEISLSDFAGESNVSLRFKLVSDWGNSAWLDNVRVGMPTSTYEELETEALSVYPNPAQDFVNVDINVAESSNVTLSVSSINGALVDQIAYGKLSGKHNLRYDLSNLDAGMYMIKIVTGDKAAYRKVSVIK